MMSYCVWKSPMKAQFLEITQTRNYTGSSNGKSYTFSNKNAFLDQMEGVLSGKTGYTAKAGYCYVAAYEENGKRYCVSLLACGWPNNKTYKWSDTRTLFTYGRNHYDKKRVELSQIEKEYQTNGYVVPPEFKSLNRGENIILYGSAKEYEVLISDSEEVKKEILLYKNTELPIKEGQVLGMCKIYVEDMLLDEIELIATDEVRSWKFVDIFEAILYQFLTFSS